MTQQRIKKVASRSSTWIGIALAVLTAWNMIDWTTFDIQRDYMKLILSGAIAAIGVISTVKTK